MVKARFSIGVEEDIVEWIDEEIKKKKFRNRSHAFEYCVYKVKEMKL